MTSKLMNISFTLGMELRVTGIPRTNCARFAINVGESEENIALHFNVRFDQDVIVMNSRKDGRWGQEVRKEISPFQLEKEFKLTFTFSTDEGFYINLHDGHMLQFPNRLSKSQYNGIWISPSADIMVSGICVQ